MPGLSETVIVATSKKWPQAHRAGRCTGQLGLKGLRSADSRPRLLRIDDATELAAVKGWALAMLARQTGGLRVAALPRASPAFDLRSLWRPPEGRSAPRNIGLTDLSKEHL